MKQMLIIPRVARQIAAGRSVQMPCHGNVRCLSSTSPSSYLEELFSLRNRSAIITGGGTGIGAALAMGLARAGAHVILTGRRPAPLEKSCRQIRQQLAEDAAAAGETLSDDDLARRAVYHPCDVTDYNQTKDMMKECAYITGGLAPTILIHNAGMNVRKPAAELTSEDWQSSLELMLTAPFMLTRAMSENMKQQQYGRIISIASLQSFRAFPDSIPYASAKSGLLGFTRAVAEAYSTPRGYPGVTCNAVAPGYVKTDLTAAVFADEERSQRLAQATCLGSNSVPEDLVGAVIFLASPASSYITGQCLPVDGGFTAMGMR